MQSVLNASARLVFDLRRSDHITDALFSLHWLRASERIKNKNALLMFRDFRGDVHRFLTDTMVRVADVPARRRLRSSMTTQLIVTCQLIASLVSAAVHFRLCRTNSLEPTTE